MSPVAVLLLPGNFGEKHVLACYARLCAFFKSLGALARRVYLGVMHGHERWAVLVPWNRSEKKEDLQRGEPRAFSTAAKR